MENAFLTRTSRPSVMPFAASASCIVALSAAIVLVALAPPSLPSRVADRIRLSVAAAVYEASCSDVRWPVDGAVNVPMPPKGVLRAGQDPPEHVRRGIHITFVRHGHSYWNLVANRTGRGGWRSGVADAAMLAGRVCTRLVLPADDVDTVLYDARLTPSGHDDAAALNTAVVSRPPVESQFAAVRARAAGAPVLLVASNLRRAIETAWLGFSGTVLEANASQPLLVDASLQESCCKLDALSLQEAPGRLDERVVLLRDGTTVRSLGPDAFDARFNTGDKRHAARSDVWSRMDTFVQNVFEHYQDVVDQRRGAAAAAAAAASVGPMHVVVVGHSAWFRRFFLRYLAAPSPGVAHIATVATPVPGSAPHLAPLALRKLTNGAAVEFELGLVADGAAWVPSIDPASVRMVHGSVA